MKIREIIVNTVVALGITGDYALIIVLVIIVFCGLFALFRDFELETGNIKLKANKHNKQ